MTYCNACMGCPLEAVVRNDNVVFTRAAEIPDTDRDIKRMCARGASIPVQLVEGKRIKYPMKRVEGTERGAGQWERISWDEAINTICEKIKGYQNEFGKSSVCAFTYGTTEPRNLYNLYRLENLAEFSHQERTTDFALAQALYVNIGGYYFQAATIGTLLRVARRSWSGVTIPSFRGRTPGVPLRTLLRITVASWSSSELQHDCPEV